MKIEYWLIAFFIGICILYHPIQASFIKILNPEAKLCLTYEAKKSFDNSEISIILLKQNHNYLEIPINNTIINHLILGKNYTFVFGKNKYAEDILKGVENLC